MSSADIVHPKTILTKQVLDQPMMHWQVADAEMATAPVALLLVRSCTLRHCIDLVTCLVN